MGKKKISTGVWLLGLLIVFCSYTGVVGAKTGQKQNRDKVGSVGRSFYSIARWNLLCLRNACVPTVLKCIHQKISGSGNCNGLALHKDDVWADSRFWAPEIYEIDGKFYMYYTADEHICVAIADSPLGPFRQNEKKPMVAGEKMIDSSLFIDEDGKPYLFFVPLQ